MYDETVTNQIAKLPTLYQEFILREMPAVMAEAFVSTYNLDEEGEAVLGNAIILFLIFLLDRDGFKDFISRQCQIDLPALEGLDYAIVTSLPDYIKEIFLKIESSLDNLSSQSNSDLISEISAVEASLKTLNSSTENTYTSTQAAILQEGRNAQNLNSQTNSGNPGRWESDR